MRQECPHFFLYTAGPLVIPEQTLINGQNLCDIYTTKIKYQQSIWKYYGHILFLGQTPGRWGLYYCPVLTSLGELPHPGEVVHVTVTQQWVRGQVELGSQLQRGVGGQRGQVDSHQLVAIQSANKKHLRILQPELFCLPLRPIKLSLQVLDLLCILAFE